MKRLPTALLIVLAFTAGSIVALAQGTAFTYQGELLSAGSPANGSFDMELSLFNAATNGTQIGGTVTNLAVGVTNGLFTAAVDFGATPYNGQALWLQIGVRTNGGTNAFVALSPLQQLASTPYAIRSASAISATSASGVAATNITGQIADGQLSTNVALLNGSPVFTSPVKATSFTGNGGALANLNATNVTGTLPLASLPGAAVTNGATNVTLTGTFNGNGGGLTGLNASQISGGTLNSSLLPSNAVTLSGLVSNQTIVYSSAGTSTLTIPLGVSQMVVKLWGAGGGSGYLNGGGASGGGGAFVQKTVAVTAGQSFTIVVGQRGDYNNNDLGGSGGVAPGGFAGPVFSGYGGQGGQASSLIFNVTGSNYILEAMAGGGGGGASGGSMSGPGGAGGNPGATGPDANAAGAGGGYNGSGGAGGSYYIAAGNSGSYGSPGAGIAANATSTGVASPGSIGGGGGAAANNSSLSGATSGGGGGGGYGGGGGGAIQTENYGEQYFSFGGGGGGSYGDVIVGGSGSTPGNTSDPNYVSPNGTGGGPNGAPYSGSDGLAVVILENPVASVPGIVTASAVLGNANTNLVPQLSFLGRGFYPPLPSMDTNNGPEFMLYYNGTNNRQLALADSAQIGQSTNAILRVNVGGPSVAIDAVQETNASEVNLVLQGSGGYLGIGGNVGIGGKLGVGTNNSVYPLEMGSGAYCSVAGAWVNVSDRNVKENFQAVDPLAVLARVAALPITEWNYKVEPATVKHLGPVAQDFHAAFGLGDNEKAIGSVDEAGVALAAIQGVNEKLENKSEKAEGQIEELKAENAELKSRLEKLEQRLNALTGAAK